jgi:mannan endo-1,4-beta-mannosidase
MRMVAALSLLWNVCTAAAAALRDRAVYVATANAAAAAAAANASPALPRNWAGVNSFFLHALSEADQNEVIQNLHDANVKVVRIFISGTYAGFKGSSSVDIKDVETDEVGAYDDDILDLVDSLMLRMSQKNMKLIVTLHDRYALGCWSSDAYVDKYELPVSNNCGNNVNQPTAFYNDPDAIADFDKRIQHIVQHQNPYFGNKTWGALSEAVYAIDVENESQGYMAERNEEWMCGRAAVAAALVSDGVLVGTGGGTGWEDSLSESYLNCSAIDLIGLHSYDSVSSFVSNFDNALRLTDSNGKLLVFEEYGQTYDIGNFLSESMAAANFYQIPSMVWEVMKPNNAADYEFYAEDTEAWAALTVRSSEATISNRTGTADAAGAFSFGAWCVHNADCASNCCSNRRMNTFANNGHFQCVDAVADDQFENVCRASEEDSDLPTGSFCAKSTQCAGGCCGTISSASNAFMECVNVTLVEDTSSLFCMYV